MEITFRLEDEVKEFFYDSLYIKLKEHGIGSEESFEGFLNLMLISLRDVIIAGHIEKGFNKK
jgi:hypothetical protein